MWETLGKLPQRRYPHTSLGTVTTEVGLLAQVKRQMPTCSSGSLSHLSKLGALGPIYRLTLRLRNRNLLSEGLLVCQGQSGSPSPGLPDPKALVISTILLRPE